MSPYVWVLTVLEDNELRSLEVYIDFDRARRAVCRLVGMDEDAYLPDDYAFIAVGVTVIELHRKELL